MRHSDTDSGRIHGTSSSPTVYAGSLPPSGRRIPPTRSHRTKRSHPSGPRSGRTASAEHHSCSPGRRHETTGPSVGTRHTSPLGGIVRNTCRGSCRTRPCRRSCDASRPSRGWLEKCVGKPGVSTIQDESFSSPRKCMDRKLASALIGLLVTGCRDRLGTGASSSAIRIFERAGLRFFATRKRRTLDNTGTPTRSTCSIHVLAVTVDGRSHDAASDPQNAR